MPGRLAICRLVPDEPPPVMPSAADLWAVVRTADELTLVCDEASVPEHARAERGWRALRVQGPFELDVVGVLAELAGVLARAQVSLFAVSTFDTDYLLLQDPALADAVRALRDAGHDVRDRGSAV